MGERPSGVAAPGIASVAVRTALLAASLLLLFPALLDSLTHGAWPRLVTAMGTWRWVAWGACFAAMTLMRFAGGPKRGS